MRSSRTSAVTCYTDEPTDSGDADDGWNADPQMDQCHLILILVLILVLVLVRLIHGLRTRLGY